MTDNRRETGDCWFPSISLSWTISNMSIPIRRTADNANQQAEWLLSSSIEFQDFPSQLAKDYLTYSKTQCKMLCIDRHKKEHDTFYTTFITNNSIISMIFNRSTSNSLTFPYIPGYISLNTRRNASILIKEMAELTPGRSESCMTASRPVLTPSRPSEFSSFCSMADFLTSTHKKGHL